MSALLSTARPSSVIGYNPLRGVNPLTAVFSSFPSASPSPTSAPSSSSPTPSRSLHSTSSDPHTHKSLAPVLADVLPILFGSIVLLVAMYSLLACQRRKAQKREEETQARVAKLRRRERVVRGGLMRSTASTATNRSEAFELEVKPDMSDETLLQTLKFREDAARLERSRSFATFDLPRKPPPSYYDNVGTAA